MMMRSTIALLTDDASLLLASNVKEVPPPTPYPSLEYEALNAHLRSPPVVIHRQWGAEIICKLAQ